MKAIYMKPSLKSIKIDAEESMLAGSGEYNLAPTGESYTASQSKGRSPATSGRRKNNSLPPKHSLTPVPLSKGEGSNY